MIDNLINHRFRFREWSWVGTGNGLGLRNFVRTGHIIIIFRLRSRLRNICRVRCSTQSQYKISVQALDEVLVKGDSAIFR